MAEGSYIKTHESLDKAVVLASLVVVAIFLRYNQPSQEPSGPPIPSAPGTMGMDELWKDAVSAQKSGLDYLPRSPEPPSPLPEPALAAVEAEEVPPLEAPASPEPAPPVPKAKPPAKLKILGFSFADQAASATSSAFFSAPKAAPAPQRAKPLPEPMAYKAPEASPPRTQAPRGRPWRKVTAH